MLLEKSRKAFLDPNDLVDMGLFRDTGHVFRAIKNQTNVPPHVRLSKKNIRFPQEDFSKWLLEQTGKMNEETQHNQTGEQHE